MLIRTPSLPTSFFLLTGESSCNSLTEINFGLVKLAMLAIVSAVILKLYSCTKVRTLHSMLESYSEVFAEGRGFLDVKFVS